MYKEWSVNGTFKRDLSTEWTMILKLIFCTLNQQMHTTVIRYTTTFLKKH